MGLAGDVSVGADRLFGRFDAVSAQIDDLERTLSNTALIASGEEPLASPSPSGPPAVLESNTLSPHGEVSVPSSPSYPSQQHISAFSGGYAANSGSGAAPTQPGAAQPSTSTGNVKALLVGINYISTDNELRGCINDANNHKEVIKTHFGFPESNIRLLTDDQGGSNKPTKSNILAGLDWLVRGAKEGDILYFQYSGHGTQYPDEGSGEADGKDEAMCPLDCDEAPWPKNLILDDELHDKLFCRVPQGVR